MEPDIPSGPSTYERLRRRLANGEDDSKDICPTCQKTFHSFAGFWSSSDSKRIAHHETWDSFVSAAGKRCLICSVLFEVFSNTGNPEPQNYHTEAVINCELWRSDGGIWRVQKVYRLTFKVMRINDNFDKAVELQMYVRDFFGELVELRSPLPEGFDVGEVPENTGDPRVLQMAKHWFSTTCRSDNALCSTDGQQYFPRRLLDITNQNPRLLHSEIGQPQGPYATLSHCWGLAVPTLRLTKQTEAKFYQAIPLSSIPRTFRDAIHIAKYLGIRYIWIDTLCIIQEGDDGHDWTDHSTMMRDIYANCILNISADSSKDPGCGIFSERRPPISRPLIIRLANTSGNQKRYLVGRMEPSRPAYERVAQRAWVLQERILSPRVLHFTSSRIYWECTSHPTKWEMGSGPRDEDEWREIYRMAPFKLGRPKVFPAMQQDDYEALMNTYTRMNLTYPGKDKLVAVAGILQLLESHYGDTMVAGLRKSMLPNSLMWTTQISGKKQLASRAQGEYRAPSWSWASMDGPIVFHSSRVTDTPVATVLDCKIDLVDPSNHLGLIKSGSLTLQGPASYNPVFRNPSMWRPGKHTYITHERSGVVVRAATIYFDDPDTDAENMPQGTIMLVVNTSFGIKCLLLQPCQDRYQSHESASSDTGPQSGPETSLYSRIGVVQLHGEDFEKKSGNIGKQEWLSTLEVVTVTIV